MEHGSVRSFAAAEMMALDHAGESATLADPDHVHHIFGLELVDQNFVPGLQVAVAAIELEFADELRAFHSGFLQMTGGWLVNGTAS